MVSSAFLKGKDHVVGGALAGFGERLWLLDPRPETYWSTTAPITLYGELHIFLTYLATLNERTERSDQYAQGLVNLTQTFGRLAWDNYRLILKGCQRECQKRLFWENNLDFSEPMVTRVLIDANIWDDGYLGNSEMVDTPTNWVPELLPEFEFDFSSPSLPGRPTWKKRNRNSANNSPRKVGGTQPTKKVTPRFPTIDPLCALLDLLEEADEIDPYKYNGIPSITDSKSYGTIPGITGRPKSGSQSAAVETQPLVTDIYGAILNEKGLSAFEGERLDSSSAPPFIPDEYVKKEKPYADNRIDQCLQDIYEQSRDNPQHLLN
ncbi:hypothetical protein BJ085DRAFT_36894 [Dimargaris cristalligena]|uniref:Uncharacterized protein n=1 Tax=Dimargaris cristalligena TaxID=215637 RepID=A0A4P9ZPZ3_9FUNG|nr:hypothetical protein BJ085DRAFT_36894 [Dimargaris cristalligena]|eukprot:RKP35325.1 hypothetical protein BJ085DRAFT_36894 [Dimargaris cristalligena]